VEVTAEVTAGLGGADVSSAVDVIGIEESGRNKEFYQCWVSRLEIT
jgi:hypothetical protein